MYSKSKSQEKLYSKSQETCGFKDAMERVNYIQSHKKHTDSKTMERVNHIQSHKLGNIYGIKGHGKGKLYSKSDETCRYIDRQTILCTAKISHSFSGVLRVGQTASASTTGGN